LHITPKDQKSHIIIAFPKIKKWTCEKKYCWFKDLVACEDLEVGAEITAYLIRKYFLLCICDITLKN
jgi:hypothetical protein